MYKANVAGCTEVAGLYRGLNRSHCEGSLNCHEGSLIYRWETVASGTSDTRMALGAISACPALFPCKNALPARNRLGVAQDTCLQESRPLARARRKELSLRDLAAKAQRQQQRNKSKKSIKLSVVSQLRQPTDKKNSSICLKKVCSGSRNTFTCLRVRYESLLTICGILLYCCS